MNFDEWFYEKQTEMDYVSEYNGEFAARLGWNACELEKNKKILELRKKIERYERGDFTRDEIHNFCHNLEKTVSLEEFKRGCKEYQNKLFQLK